MLETGEKLMELTKQQQQKQLDTKKMISKFMSKIEKQYASLCMPIKCPPNIDKDSPCTTFITKKFLFTGNCCSKHGSDSGHSTDSTHYKSISI